MKQDILTKILQSPQLPWYAEQIANVVAAEQHRRDEFYRGMKESEKVEFINGVVVFQSPIVKQHGEASDNLLLLIKTYVELHRLGFTGHEKYLVSLSRNDYEPDICFWGNEKAAQFTEEQMHFPAPDFIVEVLSKSTEKRDRGIKMEDYALHGVTEYWLVDPRLRVVEQYLLTGRGFALQGRYSAEDLLTSRAIAGFAIPVSAIFDKAENLKALRSLLK